jgi:hypothetical protein
VNSAITRRVIEGDSSALSLATTRIAVISYFGGAVWSTKPLALACRPGRCSRHIQKWSTSAPGVAHYGWLKMRWVVSNRPG